ncbi:vesicle-associated protein 3-1-like [Triticum aestivum]|uniref:vesicle-associated protein 3-1-like n=1 Tax=Triticum aestivum TaxID=4565 RepID=UPI001D022F09|nr:vesicle-associated protein 3-1-like [Triticum aestivum]
MNIFNGKMVGNLGALSRLSHRVGSITSYAIHILFVPKNATFFSSFFLQLSPYSEDDDMLGIEPLELHFPFQLNKQMSCTIQLTNETDSYIAFNVEHMNPLSYCAQPQKDIMPPRSKCNVKITMQPQAKAPRDHTNEFTVWSTKVNDGLAIEDMATIKFIKEAANVVDDVNLDVVFDVSEPQEARSTKQLITDDAVGPFFCIDAHQTEPLIVTGHKFGDVLIWNYETQQASYLYCFFC